MLDNWLYMILAVEYSTTLKSLLNTFWFFDSCLLLICSSVDMIEQENIIKRFLAIFSGFTCHLFIV